LGVVSKQAELKEGTFPVLFEEWGAEGSNKAQLVTQFATSLKAIQVPWLYWEVTKPGQGAANYEMYVSN
jgi:hypothetical protein